MPAHDPASPCATEAVIEALAGIICGFYDMDLRDAMGPGHGRMIQKYGTGAVRHRRTMRLAAGDLVGIAATERHGGSRLQEITTLALPRPGGWWLDGEKCWVSRLDRIDQQDAAHLIEEQHPVRHRR